MRLGILCELVCFLLGGLWLFSFLRRMCWKGSYIENRIILIEHTQWSKAGSVHFLLLQTFVQCRWDFSSFVWSDGPFYISVSLVEWYVDLLLHHMAGSLRVSAVCYPFRIASCTVNPPGTVPIKNAHHDRCVTYLIENCIFDLWGVPY